MSTGSMHLTGKKKKICSQTPLATLWCEVLAKAEVKVQEAGTLFNVHSSKSRMRQQETEPSRGYQRARTEGRNSSQLRYSSFRLAGTSKHYQVQPFMGKGSLDEVI